MIRPTPGVRAGVRGIRGGSAATSEPNTICGNTFITSGSALNRHLTT